MRMSLPLAGIVILLCGANAYAQTNEMSPSPDRNYIEELEACRLIESDDQRLACFDKAVGQMLAANKAGEVQVLEKADVEKTRRSLFGLSLPNLGIFGGGDDDSKETKAKRNLLETTITSVHYSKPDEIYFVTEEGATWRISNAPSRLRKVEVGQSVVFKKAAMGSFFIRVNGQTGVKGRRVR